MQVEKNQESCFLEWFMNSFDFEKHDFKEIGGVDAQQFGPFNFYTDTSKLYARFEQEIWILLRQACEQELGVKIMTAFDVLDKGGANINSPERLKGNMVQLVAGYLEYALRRGDRFTVQSAYPEGIDIRNGSSKLV